ncbi:integrin alpha-6-like [Pagrus major]|uniref:integrin alpha-6-like n=1 Tax=Pagrus major TaxID=143350 RepID=UPI003CC83AA5
MGKSRLHILIKRSMGKHWCVVYLCSVWHLRVAAFNLDTQNVLQRNGDPGSLFGFSVAFHQQLNPARRNLLLVGAPRAKHQNQVNVTGVVYQCDLTATSERCQPIEFGDKAFLDSKGINNQWMGVRVASQGPGKHIMACAHRYQQKCQIADTPCVVLSGQCYLLGDDLQVGKEEGDKRRVVCDKEHLERRSVDHGWFAYCQQGHGASFAKDNKSLLFGAPGAYHWKGIVRMEPLDQPEDSDSNGLRETGNNGEFDPKLIPLQTNSYLGFSIDSGLALIRKGELTIVSGAPRGGYSGQVAFLKADPVAERNVSVELVLSGPGLASSFGYDVAVVDLNSDGWEDLAVGAPQFYDGLVGGAVYVYINSKGKNWEKIVPTQLLGPKESMFGLAVENIGDVNQDGYGDIAVGAPYDGSGRVYLYYGSSEGIHKKTAQVLSPGSKKVTLFGYSLSGNLDVDDNQYPDLAVGSLSDSVFVYRARPVVSISSSVKLTPGVIDITKDQCQTHTCYFSVEACFTYTAHPASLDLKLMLNFTFEADAGRRKARVDFLSSSEGRLELPEQRTEICTNTRLRLQREIKDKLLSIPVSVSVSLSSSGPTSATRAGLSDVTPVLNLFQQKSTVSEIVLVNEGCGTDNICQSNLELQFRFCSRNTTQNNRVVFKSLAREDGVAVITPSDEDIALEITVTNSGGDDAHQAHAVINLPDTLRYSSIVYSKTDQQKICTANKEGTRINCTLGNPFQRDAEVTFYVILATSSISLSTKEVNVTLQLNTTSVQTIQPVEALAKVLFELELHLLGLARPSQVSLEKSLKGESAVKSVDEIGAPVQYEFKIANLGRPLKSFINASLNIYWPKENSVGKWFLYLTQTNSSDVHSVPCSPANEVNPLKDLKGWREPSRRRREAEHAARSIGGFSYLSTGKKYKSLTCSDGLKCVEIRCPLLGLDKTATIVLHSRLWNATFTEDYSSLNYLYIVVDATLSLTNSPENIGLKMGTLETKVKLTVFLDRDVTYFVKVAWWIIFLTVIVLLLMLAVFVFLVWKRGSIKCLAQQKKP